jgi:iron complex outermembrane receptor protein
MVKGVKHASSSAWFKQRVSVLALASAFVGVAAFGAGGTALAQGTPTAQQGGIPTINVTAEKRSENVQNVPIAITAFTSQSLQDKAIGDLHGLSNLTPNVNLDSGAPFSGDSSVLSASIRGIGQDDFAFNIDPGVGVYVDGVYLGRTIGANVNLLDVARVEVLKGPQGTLFGRNTIGGAISIVTRNPGDKLMFQGQFTTGSLNRRDFAGTADIPLTDNLRSSFTFESVNRDGYQHVIPFPNPNGYIFDQAVGGNGASVHRDNAYGGQNHTAIRAKLVWTPNDKLTANLSADWTHQDQQATPTTVLQTYPNTPGAATSIAGLYMACLGGALGQVPPGPNFDNLCTLPRSNGWPPGTQGLPAINQGGNILNLPPISPATTQTGNIDTTYASGPNFAKYDTEGFALTLSYELGDNMTAKSITGYRHITWNIGTNLDGSPANGEFLSVTDKQQQQQVSEELQLLGNLFDAKLNYVLGLYFFHEDGFVHDWVQFDGGFLAVEDSGLNDLSTNSYAGYFHADYAVTDKLGVTVGARYSVDHKEFLGGQQDLNGLSYKASGCYPPTASASLIGAPAFLTCQEALGFPVAGQPYRYFPAGWNSRNFYQFTPTVSLQYHFTDNVMSYVRFSKGFKSGGWTTRLSDPISDAKVAQFGPEKAKTYEGGIKSEWFNHRLRVNAAGFYTDYTDIQLNQQVAASPVLKNLGSADIFGAELESLARLTPEFSIAANVGYLSAEYTSLDPSVGTSVTLNSKLPKTPKWKITINPQYNHEFGNGNALQVQLTYTHVSSLFNDSLNTPLLKRPTLNLLDASVQYSFDDNRYSVAVGGTNITGKRYISSGSVNYAAGFVDATYNPPAAWYLRLRMKV